MVKTILFDFDGTIADSFGSTFNIIQILAQKYKFKSISRDELEELRKDTIHTLFKKLNIPFYKLPFLAFDMKKLQGKDIQSIPPFAHIPDVLHALKSKGYTLGMITSNSLDNVSAFIKKNNIDVFTHIHTDTHVFGKDKALQSYLRKYKLQKEEIVYVGDEIRDIEASHKVGVKIASVTWGYNSKEGLLKYKPDYLLDKSEDLLQLFA